jgi:hypothetical protein
VSNQKNLPRDPRLATIGAGTGIDAITNVTLNASTYVAIAVPTGKACKSFLAQARSGSTWYFSADSAGATYLTLSSAIALALAAEEGTILFYAKGSAADTLEVVFIN